MPLFGKKQPAAPGGMPPPGGNPIIDQINAMRQQGYADNDIVSQLQAQGAPPEQIQDAMNQSGMMPGGPIPPDQGMPPDMGMPPMGDQGMPPPGGPPGMPPGAQVPGGAREQMEEVAESIVQEKWNDLLKDLNKLKEWQTKTDTDISKITSDVENLKQTFDNLHKGVLGKIGEYDKNLTMVGTEIKAMEKVFQKVLPTFTENVGKLERLTKRITKKS